MLPKLYLLLKTMQKYILRNKALISFILPSLIGVLIFNIFPFIDVIRRSFMNSMGNEYTGMANYGTVINNKAFQIAVANTCKFLLLCIPILLFVSLIMALFTYQAKKGYKYKTIFLLPMAIPVASIVLIWRIFFHEYGILNGVIEHIGIEKIDYLHTGFALVVLIFTYVWRNFGYDMILWSTGMDSIDGNIYEAANIDGAGKLEKFLYITLPLISPFTYVILVLSVLNAFKAFREAYLIAGDYPHESIYLLQHLFNNWFVTLDMGKICAAAVMVTIVIGILALVLQRVIFERE